MIPEAKAKRRRDAIESMLDKLVEGELWTRAELFDGAAKEHWHVKALTFLVRSGLVTRTGSNGIATRYTTTPALSVSEDLVTKIFRKTTQANQDPDDTDTDSPPTASSGLPLPFLGGFPGGFPGFQESFTGANAATRTPLPEPFPPPPKPSQPLLVLPASPAKSPANRNTDLEEMLAALVNVLPLVVDKLDRIERMVTRLYQDLTGTKLKLTEGSST